MIRSEIKVLFKPDRAQYFPRKIYLAPEVTEKATEPPAGDGSDLPVWSLGFTGHTGGHKPPAQCGLTRHRLSLGEQRNGSELIHGVRERTEEVQLHTRTLKQLKCWGASQCLLREQKRPGWKYVFSYMSSHGQWYPSKPGWQLLGLNQKSVIIFENKRRRCSTVQKCSWISRSRKPLISTASTSKTKQELRISTSYLFLSFSFKGSV